MINLVGNTANYVNSIPVPEDGVDDDTAASLDGGFQQLADNAATIRTDQVADEAAIAAIEADVDDLQANLHLQSLTVNSTTASVWTAPANCFVAWLIAWGGGGGGGGGCGGGTTAGPVPSGGGGGGGGGGAQKSVVRIDVTPGTAYDANIGAGGAKGTGGAGSNSTNGTDGTDGSDGGDTTFVVHGGSTVATFYGGGKGKGGTHRTSSTVTMTPGGLPVRGGFRPAAINNAAVAPLWGTSYQFVNAPGGGGDGVDSATTGRDGLGNASWTGGAAGTSGSGSNIAGGGGGGGGAGGGGNGGAGGNGGTGAGAGTVGTAGTNGGANTGGGGGGGGGGKDGTAGSAPAINGQDGGNGGSGQLTIVWVANA